MNWTEMLREHTQVLGKCLNLSLTISDIAKVIKKTLDRGSKVILCGNGGSFSQAQHFAAELVVRYQKTRNPYGAVVLGSNPAITSAICNDMDPTKIFAREFDAIWRHGDCLVALSTSGKSFNIIDTIQSAGPVTTIALTGENGMAAVVDYELRVPSSVTAIIQQVHQIVIHAICEELDKDVT